MSPEVTPDQFVGWYNAPGQIDPAHMPDDPPCPVCGKPLGDKHAAKWVSLMWADKRDRSLFYGLHQECADAPRQQIEKTILDWSTPQ